MCELSEAIVVFWQAGRNFVWAAAKLSELIGQEAVNRIGAKLFSESGSYRTSGSIAAREHEVAPTFQCAVPGFSFALTMASASLPYSSSK